MATGNRQLDEFLRVRSIMYATRPGLMGRVARLVALCTIWWVVVTVLQSL